MIYEVVYDEKTKRIVLVEKGKEIHEGVLVADGDPAAIDNLIKMLLGARNACFYDDALFLYSV